MGPTPRGIRTPDQRLRVFVSSTLRELADERRAVRSAIERLALAPVMFELGARPHPPRSLYRSYLEQSDIFVGIYWEQYGWVAPGEEVSGLEDEWNLAPDIPKLIYLKRSEHRHERLDALLERIRRDDRASYVAFTDAAELATLVTADLATLLAERFDAAGRRDEALGDPATEVFSTEPVRLPSPLTRLVGRLDELGTIAGMLTDDRHRLVTITGPGGIGKSRLAVAAAREVESSYPNGVVFVDLAPVLDPALAITAVANALGIRDAGDLPLAEKVRHAIAGRRMLIVLDNVEQVVDSAPELTGLLLEGSRASVLATSRILLRVRGEQNVPLGPLPSVSAVELFVERARAVKPDFELDAGNAAEVTAICEALDNAPLALELAAARLRVLTTSALVERLDHALPLLVTGARDLPERQRTLRATIDWSAKLLSKGEAELLQRLGVFRVGFDLDAVEWMAVGLAGVDAMDALGALVDGSLVREQDRGSRPWFTMLATVREYGRDLLAERGRLAEAQGRHAAFYVGLAIAAGSSATWQAQVERVTRLLEEQDELRAAVDHLFESQRFDDVAELAWPMYTFWWGGGRAGEIRSWMSRLLENDAELTERSRIIAEYCINAISYWRSSDFSVVPALARCADFFRHEGDRRGESLALAALAVAQFAQEPPGVDAAEENARRALQLADEYDDAFAGAVVRVMVGRMQLAQGRGGEAELQFETSLAQARRIEDLLGQAVSLSHLGWVRLLGREVGRAGECFAEELLLTSTIGHEEGIADAFEGLFAVAETSGDAERAGMMLGAAEGIRARKGLPVRSPMSFYGPYLDRLLIGSDADRFEEARRAGREAELADIVEVALA
ncbi:MAG: ATPase-like protein [Agromyces sp.]|jgi:predicted ATPase|nr:ATPase-like protein [Agromyces sp.]